MWDCLYNKVAQLWLIHILLMLCSLQFYTNLYTFIFILFTNGYNYTWFMKYFNLYFIQMTQLYIWIWIWIFNKFCLSDRGVFSRCIIGFPILSIKTINYTLNRLFYDCNKLHFWVLAGKHSNLLIDFKKLF
jgi:hypothetical protein